jgi:sec-independent protein translocase protein TatA
VQIPGLFQILVIALIILVLFGRGRISETMGDFGKGLKRFKRGLQDDGDLVEEGAAARVESPSPEAHRTADKPAG